MGPPRSMKSATMRCSVMFNIYISSDHKGGRTIEQSEPRGPGDIPRKVIKRKNIGPST
jgi:hypothetical protein